MKPHNGIGWKFIRKITNPIAIMITYVEWPDVSEFFENFNDFPVF
jgi:hypothetical protein